MIDFNELHKLYTGNMKKFPTLYGELSKLLNVSITSLNMIEAGFCPSDSCGYQIWTFPERDETGNVTGLSVRTNSGHKYMVKESKHGLFYGINYGKTEEKYEKTHWERVSKEYPCPLCGKADGCMYPHGEYNQPNAIVCVHIPEGSVKPMEIGYLHIYDKERRANYGTSIHSILLPSSNPILVVEGASDVCAAFDLGFTATGRPSAQGGREALAKLLSGRKTVIIGENDSGAGINGMESTFATLQPICSSCVKVLPPEGIKDLRQWKEKGLSQKELLEYIEKVGQTTLSANVFEDDIAYNIANTWLKQTKTVGGKLLLRTYRKGFIEFNGHCYEEKPDELIHGQLYNYLAAKSFIQADGAIKPYKPTRSKVGDILDACNSFCPIDKPSPSWLIEGDNPDPTRLIVFNNGILDVNDYIQDKVTLHNPTPDLFTFTTIPYDFDEDLESKLWEEFLNDIFNKDKDKVALLAQWFGYNTVPDLSYEKLMLFTGRPRSGKSTVLETLQAILGDKNCCETSFQTLAGPFGYQPLIGKLSAIIGDAKSPKSGEAEAVLEKILHITGGDAVSINIKNRPVLPLVRLICRFTIAMNDLPAFTDHSRALEYRTNILTFNNSYIGREDRTLKRKLKQEASEGKLINFALRGLASLYAGKDFILPQESALAMRTFRELVSPIVQFVESCIEYDTQSGVPVDYLYELWKWWCGREGRNVGLKSTFIRNLLSTAHDAVQIREGEADNHSRIIMGIKVSEWGQKEYMKGV